MPSFRHRCFAAWPLEENKCGRESMLERFLLILVLSCAAVTTRADEAGPQTYRLAAGAEVATFDTFQECAACPEMIVLPMGSFMMGADPEEAEELRRFWPEMKAGEPPRFWYEGPPHPVLMDSPIAMGRNEVTNEEWMACVADGACSHVPERTMLRTLHEVVRIDDPRQPVISVSFLDVLDYTAWLNDKTGSRAYRPPTEAEWEYAARSGTTTKFAQGETLTTGQGNFTLFRWFNGRAYAEPDRYGMPLPVDSLDAGNLWGLRHMSGNVSEWTMSCFTEPHLGLATSSAYYELATAATSCWLVTKGGSYAGSREYARPAFRGRSKEDRRSRQLGFRVVRDLFEAAD